MCVQVACPRNYRTVRALPRRMNMLMAGLGGERETTRSSQVSMVLVSSKESGMCTDEPLVLPAAFVQGRSIRRCRAQSSRDCSGAKGLPRSGIRNPESWSPPPSTKIGFHYKRSLPSDTGACLWTVNAASGFDTFNTFPRCTSACTCPRWSL